VREEHEIFEAGIDGGLSGRIDVRASMRQQVKELNETADRQGLKFLCPQKSLSEVHILDDLESDELGDVHGIGGGRGLSQVPPVLAKQGRILIRLQRL
jgi:hypothetical protein